ncbi:DNA polymerase III subunit delta' [Legionella parisiensis]|uniref:DNA-directed DNA polymerase n=1 Tax=Legionella parisiensis TaxID=45071 RepID=A0A1E5JV21_9GAMM|nr:DNA polymerase III subunit delta' [Legionella parisiensis]KTD41152.1 DNA polymerase III, delta' subunit [Legionella parisiensis]OEH48367.1 DNA polymerase III subunit gamma/tau [Legionella parisiensis]STX76549.1 DNA polymerase III, delta' subunit [Legionella parisiensis]
MSDIDERDPSPLKGNTEYRTQWNQMQTAWLNNRMPQSMLFVGSFDYVFMDFVKKLAQLIFCKKNDNEPCLECADCNMVVHSEHSDVKWVKPEKNSGPIKIDQIRELQNYAYLTPQRSKHRLIVIESSDRMNNSAANSLLKILEEPPPQTIFLLLAQQLSTLLPTILSRCQIIRFTSHDDLSVINLSQLAEHYSPDSEQVMIVKQSEIILDGLIAVIEQKEHPSVIAAQWNQFEFGALLWFLYLVYAQIQTMQINSSAAIGPASRQLNHLMSLLKPIIIFSQIDKLNTLRRKLSHNMNVNQILALEDLLLGLYSESKTFS